jgi:multisubunit Na+/H+ antiporter MnhE subunit
VSRGVKTVFGPRRRVTGWLAWFAVLNVVWLVFISAWVLAEEILGLFAAAVGATAAEAVREQGLAGFRFRARWLWHARVLPWRAVRESWLVVVVLARHVAGRASIRGRFRVVAVTLPEDPHEQAAKRALMTAGESFAPNGYVLTIDNRKGLMLIHELVTEDDE